jgi:hypothetical protein
VVSRIVEHVEVISESIGFDVIYRSHKQINSECRRGVAYSRHIEVISESIGFDVIYRSHTQVNSKCRRGISEKAHVMCTGVV